ncbi:MAG TPA: sugar phosphate isomerase/epimerase [Candidatus Acidoferrum sp.]|nr:sugar phosphate isomerase/epimerase [Candidatus Acidoferrum sp.]
MSRRDFVKTGAVLAAALAAPSQAFGISSGSVSDGGIGFRPGIASYTFRAFPRAQLIAFLKQLQVMDVNLKDTKDHLPMDPQAEAAALADYAAAGIKLHAAGTVYFDKDEDDDIRKKFEYAKRAGVKVIVSGDPAPTTLPRIEKFVKEYDIRIAIHNHGPEDKLWASPLDVLKAIKGLDPRIGCCIDVGHTVRAGTEVVQAIREVGPRLFNLHIKDLANFQQKESQVAVGRGKMPVREIFKALESINYKGFVDLEYEINEKDPMPGVIESLAYMRGVLAGVAD